MPDSLRQPAVAGGVLTVNALVLLALMAEAIPALVVAAVVLPLGVALTRRPQRGLLVLAALIPFDGLLVLAPGLPPLAAGWKEALVLATLGASLVAPASARAASKRALPGWTPAVAGLLVMGLISAVVIGGLQAVWGLKITFFFVLVAVAVWRCPLDARELDSLVTILFVAGVVTAIYGVVQQFMGHSRLYTLGYDYNSAIRFTKGILRSFSTFDNPFGFGYFLMLVLLIGVPHALDRPDRLRSRLFMLSLPLLLVALAASFVRGAWIGLFVGLAYLGWVRFPRLLLGLPVVAIGLLLLPTGVTSAALSSSSGAARVATWDANLLAIATHPVGVGLGSSNAAAEKTGLAAGISEEEVFHPDNEYYRAAYELGVVGLWFTVLLLVSSFLGLRASAASLPADGSLFALAVSSTVLAAGAASLVTTYFDTFPNNVYFWLLLGVVAAETRQPVDRVMAMGSNPA